MKDDRFVELQVEKIMKKVREKIKKEDEKEKGKGMKFKAEGWIHLKSGRKRSFGLYFPEKPSDETIREYLKEKRSIVSDNFKVIEL